MPKNIMKVNIFEPYELKDTDITKSHYNRRTNSNPSELPHHLWRGSSLLLILVLTEVLNIITSLTGSIIFLTIFGTYLTFAR